LKRQALLSAAVAASIGAAVWALSPWATGHNEPWDAESLYYVAALLAGGLISGALMPRPLWAHYVGSVSGQLIYELLFLKIGPLFIVGAGFLLAYSLLFLAGAFAGSRARLRFTKPPAAA
jgi:hypothetical protein